MKYAFVFASIVVIWIAVVIFAAAAKDTDITFLPFSAIAMTVVLFWIGFRDR